MNAPIDRRQMIAGSVMCGVAAASLGRVRMAKAARRTRDDDPAVAQAVTEGVAYFSQRCRDQAPLVSGLVGALRSGDLRAAKHAYVESRPPYEEIETLAASFEESDQDIDARPYVFDDGESADEFRGFHKIESLIYGYEDLTAAIPYAERLAQSVARLGRELRERDRFSAAGQFEGMISLANEIPAKKISSEEETWSDQSMLIFRHNWIGIYSQYRPFASLVRERRAAVADRVERAHEAAMDLINPHFGEGAGGTPYSRIRIRERRAIADASTRLRDALIGAASVIGVGG